MPTRPIIAAVQGLTLRICQRTVLYDIHLEFTQGTLTAIMGPGGSGKSTLGQLLAGRLPGGTEIDFFGRLLRPQGENVRLVPQQRREIGLSVRAMLMRIAPKELAAATDEDWQAYLNNEELSHLTIPLDAPVDILHRADQQLLRIAAAAWSRPQLLILDEPFAELFGGQETLVLDYVERLKPSHTIVLIEHHQARARTLADRVALLAAGQLIEVNDTESFFEHPQSMHTEQFIRSGGCTVSSIDAEVALLTNEQADPNLQRLSELLQPLSPRNEAPKDAATNPPLLATTGPVDILNTPLEEPPAGPNTGEFETLPDNDLTPPSTPTQAPKQRPDAHRPKAPQDGHAAEAATQNAVKQRLRTEQHPAPSKIAQAEEQRSRPITTPTLSEIAPHEHPRPATPTLDNSLPASPTAGENTRPAFHQDDAAPQEQQTTLLRHGHRSDTQRIIAQARILPAHHAAERIPKVPPQLTFRRPTKPRSVHYDTRGRGPQGFCWMIPGELAGAPRPGIVEPISRDLDRIARTGTQVIVTLTETELAVNDKDLELFHELVYLPVVDMEAPEIDLGIEVVRRMEAHIHEGRAVVYHCRAGLGRTGTLLVMHLIGRGMPADEALTWARSQNAYWVQSRRQEEFLHSLPVGFLREDHERGTLS